MRPSADSDSTTTAPHSLIQRFGASERIAHWLLAAAFASMLGSGVFMVRDLRPIDASDRRWLRLAPRAYLTGGPVPRAGRFDAGQKVNARLVLLVLTVLYLAALHPTTRPALRGMTFGAVRRDWAEHHHADWVASLDGAVKDSAGGKRPRRR
jgi:cytochrome b subunit of formate dehydrogenase